MIATRTCEVVNIAAPNYLHLEMVPRRSRSRQASVLRKAGGPHHRRRRPKSSTARGKPASMLRWLQLPLGAHGSILQALIRDGRLGRLTHYRGRFFSMYGSNPWACSRGASRRRRRPWRSGRHHVPRHRHGPHAGRAVHRVREPPPHVHLRPPVARARSGHPFLDWATR